MTDWELARGAMGDLEAVTAFNAPVFQCHAEITALLRQRIGASAACSRARSWWGNRLSGPRICRAPGDVWRH
jgi:hypothetical protein